MIINKICLGFSDSEITAAIMNGLQRLPPESAEQMKKLKDPSFKFEKDQVTFKCKFAMGFLPVPIEAKIELAPAMNGNAIAIRLAKLSMAMMGGNAAATGIMNYLAQQLAGKPGYSVAGDTLTVDLATLAKMKDVTINGKLQSITVCNGTLDLVLE